MNRRLVWFLIVVVSVGAYAIRAPHLTRRPMHTDEAVHAEKLGHLMDTGEYKYNPNDYHGPTIYYFALPLIWQSGATSYADIPDEEPLRMTIVWFGVALVLALLFITGGLMGGGAVWASLLIACSPAMVFYSRYFIQEMLLVFFTFGVLVAIGRYIHRRHWGWVFLAGVCAGMMQASKETSVLAFAAIGAGIVLTWAWRRYVDGRPATLRPFISAWHLAILSAIALVVATTILTGFWSHPRGAVDMVMTYWVYLMRAATGIRETGGAAAHNHPWSYYLSLITWNRVPGFLWTELLTFCAAALGAVWALWPRRRSLTPAIHFVRFLSFYTIAITLIYSTISYKTPWCLLSFLHGMELVGGVGCWVAVMGPTTWLKKQRPWATGLWRLAVIGLLVGGLWNLKAQADMANHGKYYCMQERNPFVYAHTTTDYVRMTTIINELAEVSEAGYDSYIKVVAPGGDYWPLPWYVRRFSQVAYFDDLDSAHLDDGATPIWVVKPTVEQHLGMKVPLTQPEMDLLIKAVETANAREDGTTVEMLEADLGLSLVVSDEGELTGEKWAYFEEWLAEKPGGPYQVKNYGLRPGEPLIRLCVKQPLWDRYIEWVSAK